MLIFGHGEPRRACAVRGRHVRVERFGGYGRGFMCVWGDNMYDRDLLIRKRKAARESGRDLHA